MSLSSKELHKVCHMRLQGKPWREIKEAIPHKNVYQQFKRLSMMMIYVSIPSMSSYAAWAFYEKLIKQNLSVELYIDDTKIDPSLKDDE